MFKRLAQLPTTVQRLGAEPEARVQMRVVTDAFVEPDLNAFKPTLTDAPSAQLIRLATIYQSLAKSIKPQDVRQRIEISKELAGQAVLLIEEAERTRRELILALGGSV